MINRSSHNSGATSTPPLTPPPSPHSNDKPTGAPFGNEECSEFSCGSCGGSNILNLRDPWLVRTLDGKSCRRFLFLLSACMVLALPNLNVSVSWGRKIATPEPLTLIARSPLLQEPPPISNIEPQNLSPQFEFSDNDGEVDSNVDADASLTLVDSQPPPQEPLSVELPVELPVEPRPQEVANNGILDIDIDSSVNVDSIANALMLDSINLKEGGEGWQAWNRIDAIGDQDVECQPAPFIPSNAKDSTTTICLHPVEEDIWISKSVRKFGRWGDCDRLSAKWNELAKNDDLGPNPIYVEIGGNIGTCVMEMLLVTNADIVVFEPLPSNVALLSQTLLRNEERLRNRVKLYPIALDETGPGQNVIYARKNNAGNAVVGTKNILKEEDKSEPQNIYVETLEDVFSNVKLVGDENENGSGNDNENTDNESGSINIYPGPVVSIALIKIDVEGFECRVIAGGRRVLEHAKNLKTEFVRKLLRVQGCSSKGLNTMIIDLGFVASAIDGQDVMYTHASLLEED